METTTQKKRVSIFIDHSNVFHFLCDLRKIDQLWVKWYNPRTLALKLAGNRELVKINFYCSPPPPYLLSERGRGEKQYWKQISYYEEIKKLENVELKYARLSGVRGNLCEKNLDTQLCTDLIVQATSNEYDTAILISNDGDYVSAAEHLKKMGRKIELVYFKDGLSWDLRRICDTARRARRSFFEELIFTVSNGK